VLLLMLLLLLLMVTMMMMMMMMTRQVGMDGRYQLWVLGLLPSSWREPLQRAILGTRRAKPQAMLQKPQPNPTATM
jgi:hypothetical protein